MSELAYGTYILAWPALTLGVLVVICGAVIKDAIQARKSDSDVV
ncbi:MULTISPECIES: putative transporter small subunit [unclassified Marinobacter]|nr:MULTISPECIES: putative transporter small subunit [unclassified Marinobacter]MDO6442997.1 putative transporter small subunit [Marinobacter sp. 2_MG-2023]MDO6822789.1 putative transporter small subunit [Marinobacter sp. 1_MG-2023]